MHMFGRFRSFSHFRMRAISPVIYSLANLTTIQNFSTQSPENNIYQQAITPDGGTIALVEQNVGIRILRYNGTSWNPSPTIPVIQNGYGISVSADGNTLTFGDGDYNNYTGRIIVYVRNTTTGAWSNPTSFVGTGNTGQGFGQFGAFHSLSANGQRLSVRQANSNAGVFVYSRIDASNWSAGTKINSRTNQPSDIGVGQKMLDNGTLLMTYGDTGLSGQNGFYIYSGTTFVQAIPAPVYSSAGDNYITCLVATPTGDTVVVGQQNYNYPAGRLAVYYASNGYTNPILLNVPTGFRNLGSSTQVQINSAGDTIFALIRDSANTSNSICYWKKTSGSWGSAQLLSLDNRYSFVSADKYIMSVSKATPRQINVSRYL